MLITKDFNFNLFFAFAFVLFFEKTSSAEYTEEHERFEKDLFDFKAKSQSDLVVAKDSPLGEKQPLIRPCY